MKKFVTAILLASFLSVAAVFASASPANANGLQVKKPMVARRIERRRRHRRIVRHHRRVMRRRHRKM